MSNPNDNDYKDDNDLDDIFTSHDDPMNETGIQDAIDISEDNIDDISDYDDSEDGIFAPAPEKKKTNSSALLGTVAVIALLGAGGFYIYKNPDLMARFTSNDAPLIIPTAEIPQVAPVEVAVAPQDAPAIVDVAPVQDTELENIPQPQPIANVGESVAQAGDSQTAAAVTDTAPVEEKPTEVAAVSDPLPTDMSAAPDKSSQETPADVIEAKPAEETPVAESPVTEKATIVVDTPAEPAVTAQNEIVPTPDASLPAPPSPEETKTAVEAAPVSEPAKIEPPVAAAVPVKGPEVAAKKPEPVEAVKAPEEKVLVEAPKPVKKADPVVEKKPVVTKPAKAPETVYFDAPEGKALTDIPTPSMNTKRGKNESIIVVGSKVADAGISSTNQDSGVAAANRALKLGRYDAAFDMFSDLYAANPRDTRILMGRAVALQKLGRSGEAIRAYEDVLTVDQNNPEAIVNMMGLVRKEYPALALEKLLTLRAQHPENVAILAQLGIAYADSGNLDDAAASLMQAARMEPKNPQHYFNLGVIAERMKNRTRAIAYYEKALEIDAVYGNGRAINRDMIYDRLTRLRD